MPRRTKTQQRNSQFLMCRTFGHAWFVIPGTRGALGGDPMWIRCERCDAERHDSISFVTGEVMSRSYVYPDGYRDAFLTEGDAPPDRQDFRRMLAIDLGMMKG